MSDSDNTCKYLILGAMVVAIGIILFSKNSDLPCIGCVKKEENGAPLKPATKALPKPVPKKEPKAEAKAEAKKGDQEPSSLGGYDGSDYATF